MRHTVYALSFVVVFAAPAWSATKFITHLDGSQEVPPNGGDVTTAEGTGSLTLVDLGGGQFRWDYTVTISPDINFGTLTGGAADNGSANQATGFHIHNAPRGANGGVIYGIFAPDHDFDNDVVSVVNVDNSTTISGSWSAVDGNPVGNINTLGPDLLAAPPGDVNFYFNVHTPVDSSGEIRGQIVAIPEPTSWILLLLGAVGLGAFGRACGET